MPEIPTTLGRFADPAMLVLASLAGGPKHGYAITRDVLHLSGIHLGPGTLYGALARLEQRGWVVRLPEEGRRHPYEITVGGREFLTTECAGLRSFAEAVLARAAA
jgi:DNA-binding PadR family transcriptional regulator